MIRFKSTSSSKRWIQRQMNDQFTKKTKSMNYKSRAAFKIIEVNDKFKIFNKSSKNILDLGYAPGSWSQVAVQEMQNKKINPNILGVDLIRCSPPNGVSFIQGDFLSSEIQKMIMKHFESSKADLIMSDMMTNTTGIKDVDHLGSMDLCHMVVQVSDEILQINGNLIMKFFMGSESSDLEALLQEKFTKVYKFKPQSSRDELREQFFVCLRKKKS